ncbi:serine/threonine-protein kinase [Parahaliea aestuarii]|uniref:Serine/threonine protein kinase n=1 Tax=Parahaliea aestuarii TaxID=1852021 RepID=A0A5C8ZSC7_9GAMM|nr:serine/threonine-protein kinase [Parahaliea aestuarii]TXS90570.1 serine/threonine protein kinase [Parahaliea aestuarii]
MAEHPDKKNIAPLDVDKTVLLEDEAAERAREEAAVAKTVYVRPERVANPEFETDLPATELLSADEQAAADAETVMLDATVVDGLGGGQPAADPLEQVVIKDRFVLEARLGKGGMGHVYKALDLRKQEAQDDEPYVAIKFLSAEFSRHPKALISLQREAKKSQQLAHPNVVTVYDFDRDGDQVYMTMEYLKGAPLSGWTSLEFAEGKKPSVTRLITEMAAGLAYARRQGMVHSDFKPDNVFVTVDGRIKILDFGIARIVDTELNKDSFDAGELGALTPRYASMEMLQGRPPHPADDVYALGLVAYQLFAGVHPYGGRTALEAYQEGLTPQPIKQIKRHQWKAIAHAIQLPQDKRTPSADVFLREFSGTSRRNRSLLALVGVLALTSAWLAWKASQGEGPAVPFDELPVAVQQQFRSDMELGHKSAAIGDWDGASRYYLEAYTLHPRNAEAEEGLDQLVAHLVALEPTLQSARQREYLLTMLQSYQDNEYLANHKALEALRQQLEGEQGGAEP